MGDATNFEEHAVSTDSLVQHNIATRQEIETWIKEQRSKLLNDKRDFDFQTQEAARQTTEAERKRQQLQLEHRELSAGTHDQESKVNVQQVEIEILQAERNKKEPVLRELFDQNKEKDEQLRLLLQDSENQKVSLTQQLSELQRGLQMYERLGLTFEQSNSEKIIVRFTQVDPKNPQREFSFRIRMVAESDSFVVDECHPHVAILPGLTEFLNSSADFSFFIRSMRREFKKLV
ncbi:hypothetical protein Poli38472_006778 [Pythium oligandrum]|uniref:Kinetochore protein SPC25 n=1 Tax=Pythium oligandrum TaxID=41045 RepID=A0A8K1C5P5_PYTOL|nr:hypothetical protein Poli38472_006778 [Pythium oligandrum]|eukprot:TMW56768.1 hypothetical protein Poli38472_006778 [Pythium oligandrum]